MQGTLQSPSPFSDLFFNIWHSGQLTPGDRNSLKSFLLQDCLDTSERDAIDRVLHAIRRGWIQVQ
ncbi:MAG: hypothetical protein HC925_07180 [Coleofasciculaceae cyanobacterium SM2_3_26]|nr:hypothetical protein [Coleofasciculaceae cyanobacterium SM2_3_26]